MGSILHIKKQVLVEIGESIGKHRPETGGILGCSKEGVISHFLFDRNGKNTTYKYVPSVDYLNEYMENNWYNNGITFCGMVHSHPNNAQSLSAGDLIYAKQIIQNFNNLDHLYLLLAFIMEGTTNIHYFKTFLNKYSGIEAYQLCEYEINIVE